MEAQRACDVMSLRNVMILFLSFLLAWAFPASAQRCECIDFEDLLPDQTFNLGDTFVDSGATVTVEQTVGSDGNPHADGVAMVRNGTAMAGGSGNEIFLDPFNLRFQFQLGCTPRYLTLRFSETGIGNVNIEINGDFRNEQHLSDIHGATIGGVDVSIVRGLPGQEGILELSGHIQSFMIGGFELFIDDVCPSTGGTPIYFSDAMESPGSVYQYRADTGGKMAFYTRPSRSLHTFAFAPWDPDQLYYVNANEDKVLKVSLAPGGPAEQIVHTHTTYVHDIAFDAHNTLYFSEATGGGADGKIWRIEADGSATVFYTVQLSQVAGYWGGEFAFAPDGTLFLSSGNTVPASLYEVDMATGSVLQVFYSPGESIVGFTFGPDGLLYYANRQQRIYSLDLVSGSNNVVYEDPSQQSIYDVGFRELGPSIAKPSGLWVMPYGIRGIRLDKIKPTGLIDYKDGASKIDMIDAPFGGSLLFRLNAADAIPTPAVHYYSFQYRRQGTSVWHDFDEPISVHYVRNRPKLNLPPVFPKFLLGPDVSKAPLSKGRMLYRFKPHLKELELLVGASPGEVEWPKNPLPGDVYRGHLNTVKLGLVPGRYEIQLEVFDSSKDPSIPGMFYDMIVPTGVDALGTVLTGPATVVGMGVQFTVHIDNRSCSADIEPPVIGTSTVDNCGFLRYAPDNPGNVRIGWHASHPADFGFYSFNIWRGATGIGSLPSPATTIPMPITDEVGSTKHNGDGAGNFFEFSPTLSLLSNNCLDAAAFAAVLHVYAKSTTGNGYRITQYDARDVRAFAIAPSE
ncbi:MAG: WD40 repeat domain-containing protein [Planctomycetota bacterium]|jgi:WD40 repeat protein